MVTKLYCYVDETGQDTKGDLFLVAIVLKEIAGLEILEKKLEEVEMRTGKKRFKWKKISRNIKKKYLEELIQVKELKNTIFYATYQASKEYSKLTSFTIAKAVLARESKNYTVTVIIDGLNDAERDVIREELKKLKIKYRKIRGMKDEQSIYLRLSDAMAGFLREVYEGEEYTKQFMKRFEKTSIVTEA
ncbi:DUF3800 domain-containing protein [Candidatus Gottesmanbacteria bacterium]|nr:DUF3800 domain-containing protein [Candidatus Gottesmanbacteria bacterium]